MFRALFETGYQTLDRILEGRPQVDEIFELIVQSHLGKDDPFVNPFERLIKAAVITPYIFRHEDPTFVIVPLEETGHDFERLDPFSATVKRYIGDENRPVHTVEEDGETLIADLGQHTRALYSVVILAGTHLEPLRS